MILFFQTLPIVTDNIKERKLGNGLADSEHKLLGEKETFMQPNELLLPSEANKGKEGIIYKYIYKYISSQSAID